MTCLTMVPTAHLLRARIHTGIWGVTSAGLPSDDDAYEKPKGRSHDQLAEQVGIEQNAITIMIAEEIVLATGAQLYEVLELRAWLHRPWDRLSANPSGTNGAETSGWGRSRVDWGISRATIDRSSVSIFGIA